MEGNLGTAELEPQDRGNALDTLDHAGGDGRHQQLRGVERITAAGESLVQLSHRVFGDIKDTVTVIGDSQQVLNGTIRLAGGMTV